LSLVSTSLLVTQPAPTSLTDTATLTVAQIKTGIIVGTPTAAANYTLPSGTDFEAGFSSFTNDQAYDFSINNIATNATFIITVVQGSAGMTVVGTMRIDANTGTGNGVGRFRIRRTAANTFVCYRIA
jgi:beta-glucanase (GH16 family)